MYVIAAHLPTETFEGHFHVSYVVFGLLQELQFSSQRHLFAITEPISNDSFTPIDPADTKNMIALSLFNISCAYYTFIKQLHGTSQSVSSRDWAVIVVNDQTLAKQRVRA